MLGNPLTLIYLLHCHTTPEPHPLAHIPAWSHARDHLINKGMIEVRHKHQHFDQYVFGTTEKGRFFIDHLMEIPFPVEQTTFVIPEAQ